ncbi:MAG: DUF1127 domain-containing protein [Thiofilum sp.]|uniref:DUF1127 domain-containing protein n=1 Tax=Thiofilum sp. TaxID=2212733 RepID=UPI00260040CB|nr:DUF1127 domain-containing protein [Thiofilum sp.]MBK8451948.1 DUF1127 domain-containing protein [Thiofilum sp.]
MTLLSSMISFARYGLERIEYAYTRQQLLRLDDYVLADLGISRELLEQGISAFPWKVTETLVPEPISWDQPTLESTTSLTRPTPVFKPAQRGNLMASNFYV